MLFLVLHAGEHRYALDVRQIVEILPLVTVNPIACAHDGVVGIFDYRGAPVPAIDLTAVLAGHPTPRRLSTRIVVVQQPLDDGPPFVGLIVEKATETLRREPADFASTGAVDEGRSGLGPVTRGPQGLVQRLDVDRVIAGRLLAASALA